MTLAYRCRNRGGVCDCPAGVCGVDRALAEPPPVCKCGRPTRLEDRFKLDHQPTDSPGVTIQLVQLHADLETTGVDAWGAVVTLYYCEPCDAAEAVFDYPDQEVTP